MKTFIVSVIICWLLLPPLGQAEVKQDSQKFGVSYTVTYNGLTLKQAALKEILIKRHNKDACSVNVEIGKEVENTFDDSNILYIENTNSD